MIEESKINWPVPEKFPLLQAREIHLWCTWLGPADDPDAAGETSLLSADEISRGDSFHFAPDRHRFVAARRNLRRVLAGYVGRDPATLAFSYGRFGKPLLLEPTDPTGPSVPPASNLTFNQSHCGSLWLLAVAWNHPIGVDVEEVKDLPDLALVERRIFSPGELPPQQALPPAVRQRAFFHRWTLREATAKFQGQGFDPAAPFIPSEQSELFSPTDGYVGCLAYGGAIVRIRRFGWNAGLLRLPGADSAQTPSGLPALLNPPAAPIGALN